MAASEADHDAHEDMPPLVANGSDQKDTVDSAHVNDDGEVQKQQLAGSVLTIDVKLPHDPYETQIMVSAQEQVQDIRQAIMDFPSTYQYSCFHLEVDGKRIDEYMELTEVPGISEKCQMTLVEDPYTEKDARGHFLRVRELVGAAGERNDSLIAISPGLSLLEKLVASEQDRRTKSPDELPMDGYQVDGQASVDIAAATPTDESPKTLRAISLSSWNPPPHSLRTKGHLLYLQVTTAEGEQFHITSHVLGFFVNRSTSSKFDPFPKRQSSARYTHSLLTLLSELSPSFDKAYSELQEDKSQRDPLAYSPISNALPANPWLVRSGELSSSHIQDICRTQETYLFSGVENTETLRDWNEEFQSARELPKDPVQERVFRDRLTSRLFAEFTEAACRGAVLVARGEVPPINSSDSEDAQIFVYNNIFFSYGADGVGTFASKGGNDAARVATGKDVEGVRRINQFDIDGLCTPGTVIVDYLGKRIVGQSIVPGIFRQREAGANQIDYGAVDGTDVIADNDDFVPIMNKLSKAIYVKRHPVWDKDDKRFDLEGSLETKGFLSTDGRKYVLDLYRLTPLDVNWIEKYWSDSEDVTNKAPERDYPHRMATLRPELVDSFRANRLRDFVQKQLDKRTAGDTANSTSAATSGEKSGQDHSAVTNGDSEEGAVTKVDKDADAESTKEERRQERVDLSKFEFSLNPDVFTGQTPQTDEERKEMAADESLVREVCSHLTGTVIPGLIKSLRDGDMDFPMDGSSLSGLLHKHGVNIRYLGEIASQVDSTNFRLRALKHLCIQEMISRAFKHVANKTIKSVPDGLAASCMSHLLNCFLGPKLNDSPKAEVEEHFRLTFSASPLDFEAVNPKMLRSSIQNEVRQRYRYDLRDDWIEPGREIQMLREISKKVGLQLQAKTYVFDRAQTAAQNNSSSAVVEGQLTNGNAATATKKKKRNKKNGDRQSPDGLPATRQEQITFLPDDILNFVPVVKEAAPKSMLAEEALEASRLAFAQGEKDLGKDLLLESHTLYEQIYGVLHPEVARAYFHLSGLYFTIGDRDAALDLARKAVIVSERTNGVDTVETWTNYLHLGLLEHTNGDQMLALACLKHTLELARLVYGPKHPDILNTCTNAGIILQTMKRYNASKQWFDISLTLCEEIWGAETTHAGAILFQLSQALALERDSRGAVNRMREAFNTFKAVHGPEDTKTKEAEMWLEHLTQSAVLVAKQAKDLEARRSKRLQFTPRVNMRGQPHISHLGSTNSTSAFTQTANGAGGGLDSRSIDDLLKYIEGDAKQTRKPTKKKVTNPKNRSQQLV